MRQAPDKKNIRSDKTVSVKTVNKDESATQVC